MREFLFVDDMARASVHVMNLNKSIYHALTTEMMSHINVGYGSDISIGQAAKMISEVVSYHGRIEFDTSKPDGTPRKLMDSDTLRKTGWEPSVNFADGIRAAYNDFLFSDCRE